MFNITDKEHLKLAILNKADMPQLMMGRDDISFNLKMAIESMLYEHTRKVVSAIIDELYTQDDFENDLGLK